MICNVYRKEDLKSQKTCKNRFFIFQINNFCIAKVAFTHNGFASISSVCQGAANGATANTTSFQWLNLWEDHIHWTSPWNRNAWLQGPMFNQWLMKRGSPYLMHSPGLYRPKISIPKYPGIPTLATRYSHQVQARQLVLLQGRFRYMSDYHVAPTKNQKFQKSPKISKHDVSPSGNPIFQKIRTALPPLDVVQKEADSQRGAFTLFNPGLASKETPTTQPSQQPPSTGTAWAPSKEPPTYMPSESNLLPGTLKHKLKRNNQGTKKNTLARLDDLGDRCNKESPMIYRLT